MPKSILYWRRLADASLFHFIRMMNPPPKDAYPISREIHLPLCKFSQDPTIKRKAIRMPRAWMKTICFTQWKTIWAYLKNNELRQLIAMENSDLGMKKLSFMQKQVRYNKRLRQIYPELERIDDVWCRSNQWNKSAMDLPRDGIYAEPSVSIIGVGGAAQSGHYDIIRIDDLVGKKAMESPVVMDGVLQWFDNVEELLVEPDVHTPNASSVEIVGTSWSKADFFDYILREYKEYKWMSVPCLKDFELEDEKKDNVTWIQNPESGQSESNWPEQFPTEHYTEMRANPQKSQIFWSQHMNSPGRGGEGGFNKFDVRWLKYFYIEEIDGAKWAVCKDDGEKFRVKDINLYGMIDPGGFSEMKLMKRGSRNAILIGGQPKQTKKKFIFYTWAGKFKTPGDFIYEVFKAEDLWSPRHWRIDPHGQQGYILGDIRQASREGYLLHGEKLPPHPISISKMPFDVKESSKDDDIIALADPMSQGFIYVIEGMKDLIGEVEDFPNGLTKDLVDMLGKINKLYWSRTEVKLRTREKRPQISYGVSRVTAY